MSRVIRVGAAQMGPVQKAESRQAVVRRLLDLLDWAKSEKVRPRRLSRAALTTFFPRWYMTDQAEVDAWFEREMPNAATRPLSRRQRNTASRSPSATPSSRPDGHLQHRDPSRPRRHDRRQIPQGAPARPCRVRPETRAFQHLEKRYFEPGDLGFPVWRTIGGIFGMCICNDRRWPETYRVMGLQGVEMIVLGYNTPSVNSQKATKARRSACSTNRLSVQAGAYQNSTWVSRPRNAGSRTAIPLFGGSCIVNPDGEIVAQAKTEDDELSLPTAISMRRSLASKPSSISLATAASSITGGSLLKPA